MQVKRLAKKSRNPPIPLPLEPEDVRIPQVSMDIVMGELRQKQDIYATEVARFETRKRFHQLCKGAIIERNGCPRISTRWIRVGGKIEYRHHGKWRWVWGWVPFY